VADVALGPVGIVLGLAIARLARHHADCQPLLQLCGLNQTLLGDAEALSELTPLTERRMRGLQGTRSEAELLTMRARRPGGLRQKAARGARATKLPSGCV
jgi:DNA invertase Pin-like site-specific DNA recombinase